jgi:hypothetical protein
MPWNLLQHLHANEVTRRVNRSEIEARSAEGDRLALERRLAKLELVCQGLYELLQSRVDLTDEDLRRKVREIDERDGAADQQVRPAPVRCPKCHTTATAGALYCSQCGATIAPKYPFSP